MKVQVSNDVTFEVEGQIEVLHQQVSVLQAANAEMQRALTETQRANAETQRAMAASEDRFLFTEWVASAPLTRRPLVSVILPTLGHRPTSLRQALESIRTQAYDNFEVLVVTPEPDVLPYDFRGDQRFQEIIEPEQSVGRSRNAGLGRATGEYLTYADDDNVMGPHWLRAIVWALNTDSEIDVVYGARLHEQLSRDSSAAPAFWWFEPTWDPKTLEVFNPIDTQVLAHRAGLREAVWDEELPSCVDWDLAIRLTSSGRVRPLPVRACTYTTSSPARITDVLNTTDVRSEVRRRARANRRLKLIGISHSFPRHSEHYIESELRALTPRFDVAVASEYDPVLGIPSEFAHLGSADAALREHRPDLVLFHFADVAKRLLPTVHELDIPYAVRVHSYDFHDAIAFSFEDDPLCLGVWAYPEHVASFRNGYALPALVHDAHLRPDPPKERSGFTYVSSCLPKRDWEQLYTVLGSLPGIERSAVVATCHGSEDLPRKVVETIREIDPRILVHVDMALSEVYRLLSVSSALFYISASAHPVGNPRAVIEAWLCGAIPVVPDTVAMRDFAGPHARYYRSLDEAIALIRTINTCGEEFADERRTNMDHALRAHAAPELSYRFAVDLRESFDRWEVRRV